jgi:nucleoside-diphosphate-sugar epimerase
MRVAVAGATGVLGRAAVPALTAAGHDVVGLARNTPGDRGDLVPVDVLDRNALLGFAARWRPEAIVHLATAIPAEVNPRRIARDFEATNRLRTEGTANLAAAAAAAGGARLISQSICFVYRPGPGLATEDDPLWDGPVMEPVVPAIAELERRTAAVPSGGTVLRFGHLYGPGTAFAPGGAMAAAAANRKLPILRSRGGGSTFSFIHADDAGAAIVAALAPGAVGTFNVADDEPAPVSKWLPVLAAARGGKPPRSMPAVLARPLVGRYGVAFLTELRGASNARAKSKLGWSPSIGSWREGFGRL